MAENDAQRKRVQNYYEQTTQKSYLENWAQSALGFHLGLADDSTQSLDESLSNTNKYLAERAQIGRETRVLDAGCGVGGSALYLAKTFGCSVVGITLVPQQVELARGFARDQGLESLVDVQCMDMLDTSFDEASFDVVWNIESTCHVSDLGAYLAHVQELLRDDGRFACIDLLRSEGTDPDAVRQISDGWALVPMRAPSEILALLEGAGFVDIEHVDLTLRAMKSAQTLRAMATNRLFALRAEQAFLGKSDPTYEAHARAAVVMADGMEAGRTEVAHFLARRPERG